MIDIQTYSDEEWKGGGPSIPSFPFNTAAPPGPPGLPIDSDAKFAAFLIAMKVPEAEIEDRIGKPRGFLSRVRDSQLFREMVRSYTAWLARRSVDGKGEDIEGLFNEQIGPSVAALIEVRDSPYSKGGDRIKAATEFLNRAPKAPKTTTQQEVRKTIITLPVSELQNMQRALLEEGTDEDREIVSLIEGRDFSAADGEEASGQGSDQIEVVRID